VERAIFLVEDAASRLGPSGDSAIEERVECLVNPEEISLVRTSGVAPMRSLGGVVRGVDSADDPVLYTGGGKTELLLELLFDVTLSGLINPPSDVRTITSQLFRLTENPGAGSQQAPRVRFIWGRAWNFLGVVTAMSERLEHFDEGGAPRRSWTRLRLLRVNEATSQGVTEPVSTALAPATSDTEWVELREVIGPGASVGEPEIDEPPASSWLSQLAFRAFGDPAQWRILANQNDIDDPLRVPQGKVITVPARNRVELE
jgi:hypothetical protein